MQIKIRKAKISDLKKIAELQKQQNLLHQKFDSQFYAPDKDYEEKWLKSAKEKLNSQKYLLLIAIDRNIVIGFILGDISREHSLREIKKYGFIDEIFIEKEYRGRKIGTRLMIELMKWFKSKRIKHVEFGVNSKNEDAIRFYGKLGFKEYEKTMKKAI